MKHSKLTDRKITDTAQLIGEFRDKTITLCPYWTQADCTACDCKCPIDHTLKKLQALQQELYNL